MPSPGTAMQEGLGSAKTIRISGLIAKLKQETDVNKANAQDLREILTELKVLGRDPQNADPIFTSDGIETIARASLDTRTPVAAREGLRCLANALFLRPETRYYFIDGRFAGPVADLLKSEEFEDQFLASRLLFLLTYESDLDFEEIDRTNQLCPTLNECIKQHVKLTSTRPLNILRPRMELDALTEALKLLFNLSHHYTALCTTLSASAEPILALLLREQKTLPEPHPILQQPTIYLINALMNLPLPSPPTTNPADANLLIHTLDGALTQYPVPELNDLAAPLLELLRRIHALAPPQVQATMAAALLPRNTDRAQPLGTGDSLPARLLRLSVAGAAPTLKEPLSALLFELSGRDADALVAHIGYGFAAGFLASRGIPVPMPDEGAARAMEQRGGQGDAGGGGGGDEPPAGVNFVTGQFLAEEPVAAEEPEMDEEEKLREAERLFTLFERLRATGVVDVENPVTVAAREGRLEELPD